MSTGYDQSSVSPECLHLGSIEFSEQFAGEHRIGVSAVEERASCDHCYLVGTLGSHRRIVCGEEEGDSLF